MTKPAPAKSSPVRQLSVAEEAILWAARIEDLSPVVQRVLLTLCECDVKRDADGNWIAYPSLTRLATKAGVSRRATINAIDHLLERRLMARVSGNVKGDTTVYTFGPGVRSHARTPSASNALGHPVHQGTSCPRAPRAHKSKESPSPVLDPLIGKGGGGHPPAPQPTKSESGDRRPQSGKLWPAAQPAATQAVVDKHARWWTDVLTSTEMRLPMPPMDGEEDALVAAAITRIGGWPTLKACLQRPREASIRRDEFLDYLRRHDPVYEKAVEQTIAESLGPVRLKAKSARAP